MWTKYVCRRVLASITCCSAGVTIICYYYLLFSVCLSEFHLVISKPRIVYTPFVRCFFVLLLWGMSFDDALIWCDGSRGVESVFCGLGLPFIILEDLHPSPMRLGLTAS